MYSEGIDVSKISDLIPKDKSDNSSIEQLRKLSDEEIAPILLPLLTFLQDINWPIATEILPILASHQNALILYINEILKPEENDDIWKYWIIKKLLPMFSKENANLITPLVNRIVQNPTSGELEEEVTLVAEDYLKNINVIK